MLDGAARLGELFDETERLGMPALATTDHGYLFGAFDFWRKATDKGIKPIIGVEAYVTPGTARGDKERVFFILAAGASSSPSQDLLRFATTPSEWAGGVSNRPID